MTGGHWVGVITGKVGDKYVGYLHYTTLDRDVDFIIDFIIDLMLERVKLPANPYQRTILRTEDVIPIRKVL